jgi:hypothetical protein
VGYKNSFTYTGSFNFFGLEPATQYEVIIQSRNREGWSDPSEIFKFSTRPHGKYTSYILTKNKPKTLKISKSIKNSAGSSRSMKKYFLIN